MVSLNRIVFRTASEGYGGSLFPPPLSLPSTSSLVPVCFYSLSLILYSAIAAPLVLETARGDGCHFSSGASSGVLHH